MKESLLASGERVVFTAHAHPKALVLPVLGCLVVLAAGATGIALLPPTAPSWAPWAVAVVVVVLVAAIGLKPFLAWATSTDTLTTRRLISRRGILSREGRDIPIDRVHSVTYRQSLLDRVLGAGTLVVRTAAENSDVELLDVARVERRILQMQEVMLDADIPAEGEQTRG